MKTPLVGLPSAALAFAFLAGPLAAQEPQVIVVTSPAMQTGRTMPRDYTPDGRNLSPPLAWVDLPADTRQIAVVCQDHGAGFPPPWVHWVVYNIPGSAEGLPEGIPIDPDAPLPVEIRGTTQGDNSWGLAMYRGPAPPAGETHDYEFVVYALDEALDLPPGLSRVELLSAIEGHVIGEGSMVPSYERAPMPGSTDDVQPS